MILISSFHPTDAQYHKPLVWMGSEVKSPPFSPAARIEVGTLLRRLQAGEHLELPHSRPMPTIGPRCHELRIHDTTASWRIIYHVASDAIVILDVFSKKSMNTPAVVIQRCTKRLTRYHITRQQPKHGP